jgi:deazaflavin-dependent oxidoreductase (nitroreductase family)
VFIIGRLVSPLQRWLHRVSGGRISLTGAPVLLLTTTGRKTGLARTVPLFFVRDGDQFVVCNVTPPSERTNPWTLNVRANPRVLVQVKDDSITCLAREATAAEIDRLWPELIGIWPAYERFFEQGGTRSIFLLKPAGDTR